MQEATLIGRIKDLNTKQLVSGDVTTRITLEIDNINPEEMSKLNEIQVSDSNKQSVVSIAFVSG